MRYNDGVFTGTGAAQNIELGFIPSWVRILNGTDKDALYEGPVMQAVAFDSGSIEIKAGDSIDARTSSSNAGKAWDGVVKQVVVTGGTWAGGDAAGFLILEPEGNRTIADNNEIRIRPQDGVDGSANAADVSAAGYARFGMTLATTVAAEVAGTQIVPYVGAEGSKAMGFSIGTTIGSTGEVLIYQAWSPDPGSGPVA